MSIPHTSLSRRLLVSVGLAVLLNGCSLIGESPNSSNSQGSYGLIAISLDEYWHDALAMAREWREDAYVRDIRIEVALPNSPASGSWINFNFQSPKEELLSLTVFCQDGGCESEEFTREPGHGVLHCTPIELDGPSVSSQRALEIGLAHGGRQFIYDENALVSVSLTRFFGNARCSDELTWVASFFEPATRGIEVDIDAVTGEVRK